MITTPTVSGEPGQAPTANISCPGHNTGHSSISPSLWGFVRWFDTGPVVKALNDPGLGRLRGHYTEPRSAGNIAFTWSLGSKP